MQKLSILVIAREQLGAIADALRRLLPGSNVRATDSCPATAIADDVVVVEAETNADFARVRAIRRSHRDTCVIVVSRRDRSEAAYVAGANEFATYYDYERIVQAIHETLNLSWQPAS